MSLVSDLQSEYLAAPAITSQTDYIKQLYPPEKRRICSTSQPALSGRHAKPSRLKLLAVDAELPGHTRPRAVQCGIFVRYVNFFFGIL